MAAELKDRISQDFATITDSLTSIVKGARVDLYSQGDVGRSEGAAINVMPEMYAERMLGAAENLLAATRTLKRNALLNDTGGIRAKAAAATAGMDAEAAGIRGVQSEDV